MNEEITNPQHPPAPGTIPRQTITIGEALQSARESDTGRNDTIRTYQSDVADSIKDDNVSMIKIALAEKARREQAPTFADVSQTKRSHVALISVFAAIIIIGGGVAGLYFYMNRSLPPTISETIAPNEPELLYSEAEALVTANGKNSDQIIRDVRAEMLADLDLGVIKRVLLSTGIGTSTRNTTISEFLGLIRSRASESLKASFGGQYFAGGYSSKPHDTFIIIKIDSYELAYPGMLAWEPYMEKDLGAFFPSSVVAAVATTTSVGTSTATSTMPITASSSASLATSSNADASAASSTVASVTIQPVRTVNQPTATFADRIIQNKDTRALIGLDGAIKFLYVFLDRNTLLIVSSERGLKEVQARLTTGRIRR